MSKKYPTTTEEYLYPQRHVPLREDPPDAEVPALTRLLQDRFGERIVGHHTYRGDETVVIAREGMLDVFGFLKEDPRCRFEMMVDLTAADYLERGARPRFEVVVHLKSVSLHHRLRVKVPVEEAEAEVDSIQHLWVAANWYERECWDMYGIRFAGHPDLRRLLMYPEFEGHPLRKDYSYYLQQPLVPLKPVRERYEYSNEVSYPQDSPAEPIEP